MTDVLYGFDSANVLTDAAGKPIVGRVVKVYTSFTGGSLFTATKAVSPTSLSAAGATSGLVTSDSNGRLGFWAVDSWSTLYLDTGQGRRWPVNPTQLSVAISNATAGLNVSATADARITAALGSGGAIAQAVAAAASSGGGGSGAGTNPNDVGYDLWICAGQSNMSGRGLGFDLTAIDVTNPRVWQFANTGAYANMISLATVPLGMHDTPTGLSMAKTFADQLAQGLPLNRSVLLVPVAHGGTGFVPGSAGLTWDQTLNADPGVDLARNMITQAKAALAAAGANARYGGVIWHQGENDSGSTSYAATWAARLDSLIAWTRDQLGVPDLPWVIGQLAPEGIAVASGKQALNTVMVATPQRTTRTGFAYAPVGALNVGDATTHFSAAGQRVFGRSYYDALLLAQANVTGKAPVVPRGITFSQSGSGLAVTIQRGLGRYTNHLLQYRLVGASSWTTYAHSASPEASFTLTGLATGTYEFQAATVNEQGTSAWSASATWSVVAAPGAPSGLAAGAPGQTTVTLTWAAGANATSYNVQVSTDAGATWTTKATVSGLTASLTGLASGTAYLARVQSANSLGTATSGTVSFSTPAAPLLIDTVGVIPLAAYGLRKLRSAYTGKAIKVRRDSDSATLDIPFVGDQLDTSTLIDFVATGSAYVVTLYDQSGNGRDLVQNTAASQPRIVNAGTIDGTANGAIRGMYFDGADDYFTRAAIGMYAAGGMSACFVSAPTVTAGAASGRLFGEGSSTVSTPSYNFGWAQATSIALAALIRNDANVQITPTFSGNLGTGGTWNYSTIEDSGTFLRAVLGGAVAATSTTYARSGTMTVDQFTLGALDRAGVRASWQKLTLAEFVVFPFLTDTQRQAVEASQRSRYALA